MKKYYRLVPENVGNVKRFLPNDYYERMDRNGVFDDSKLSDHLEVCFGESITRSVYGLGNWLKVTEYYVYETSTPPCLNLNLKQNPFDYQVTGEVRYRKPVESFLIGKIKISQKVKEDYQNLGVRISNGLENVTELLDEVEHIGEEVMKTFKKIQKEELITQIFNNYEIGEVINVNFYRENGEYAFTNKNTILDIHVLPSGFDLLIEDEEGEYWIPGEESRLEKLKA